MITKIFLNDLTSYLRVFSRLAMCYCKLYKIYIYKLNTSAYLYRIFIINKKHLIYKNKAIPKFIFIGPLNYHKIIFHLSQRLIFFYKYYIFSI